MDDIPMLLWGRRGAYCARCEASFERGVGVLRDSAMGTGFFLGPPPPRMYGLGVLEEFVDIVTSDPERSWWIL